MSEQTLLTCVSCGHEFDPEPSGGFCPECDTPHPEYDIQDISEADGGTESVDGGGEDVSLEDDADAGPDLEESDDDVEEAEETAESESELEPDEEPESSEADEEPEEPADKEAEVPEEPTDEETDEEPAAEEPEGEPAEEEAEAPDEAVEADAEPETAESKADEPELEEAEPEVDEGAAAEAESEPVAEVTCSSCGANVDESMSFCPSCGSELDAEEEAEAEEDPLAACPSCGSEVSGEAFCPNCGEDLDAIRADLGGAGAAPREVGLVVNGETYTFGDGDTFGRQDEPWLQDLVAASGGRDEVTYVSSQHLEFEVDEDGVYVTDVSTNGTKLNGDPLDGDRAELHDGDVLELAGGAEVEVEL